MKCTGTQWLIPFCSYHTFYLYMYLNRSDTIIATIAFWGHSLGFWDLGGVSQLRIQIMTDYRQHY